MTLSLDFHLLLWLIPILLALHNLEEVPGMATWSQRDHNHLHPPVTTPQFAAAVTLLTIAGFIVTAVYVTSPPRSIGLYILIGLQTAMLINAIFPHLIGAFRYRAYTPGLGTAVLLQIPFSLYLLNQAFRNRYITLPGFLLTLVLLPPLMLLLIRSSLWAGARLTHSSQHLVVRS